MRSKCLFTTLAVLIFAINSIAQVTDTDGKKYKTVTIGTKVWMAENLNVSHFRNSDLVPESRTADAWAKAGEEGMPAWCYYNYDTVNGKKYGKLYNWYAVNDPRGLAPKGWHVPSKTEWTMLTDYLGGDSVAGKKMKATNGWLNNGNGSNESGFEAVPGGTCKPNGVFCCIDSNSSWWSSTAGDATSAYSPHLVNNSNGVYMAYGNKFYLVAVRCIKD